MNTIEMNIFEPNAFELPPVEFIELELFPAQINAVVDVWNKYSEHVSDDIFCEEGGYCFATYCVLLMKMLECGTELRDPEERRHFISLLQTLRNTINNLKEGTLEDYAFVTDLYCDIHYSYDMEVSLV